MSVAVILVAAGRGTRAGGGLPKQYRHVAGRPVLLRSMDAILAHDGVDLVQPIIHESDYDLFENCVSEIEDPRLLPPVTGGDTRAASVRAGLGAIQSKAPRHVLIHDAARPFLSTSVIDRLLAALDVSDGAFPAIPVSDALWRQGEALASVDRAQLLRAQPLRRSTMTHFWRHTMQATKTPPTTSRSPSRLASPSNPCKETRTISRSPKRKTLPEPNA